MKIPSGIKGSNKGAALSSGDESKAIGLNEVKAGVLRRRLV